MMLKKNERLRRLKRNVKALKFDLQSLEKEHDNYTLDDDRADIFLGARSHTFEGFPITTLRESLDREHKLPRTRYTTEDMLHKFKLNHLHMRKTKELEQAEQDLRLAQIETAEEGIEEILSKK